MLVCSVLVEGMKAQEVKFEVLDFMEQVVLPDVVANGWSQ